MKRHAVTARRAGPPPELPGRKLILKEAAYLLGISTPTLRKLCAERAIPHWHIGGLYRFERAALLQFARPAK